MRNGASLLKGDIESSNPVRHSSRVRSQTKRSLLGTLWRLRLLVLALIAAPAALMVGSSATVTRAEDYHVVRVGDTLSEIADQNNMTVSELLHLNDLNDPHLIKTGMTLQLSSKPSSASVPAPNKYRVVEGDTLSGIAAQFGVTRAALEEANSLIDPDLLRVGDVLTIPASTTSARSSNSQSGTSWVSPEITKPETAAMLRRVADEFGIDRAVFLAMTYQESGWQQQVVSYRGAVGISQVLPDTAVWALDFLIPGATGWRYSSLDNARVGAAVLKHLLRLSGGDTNLALAAYYQGWQSVQTNGIYTETRQYVRNVNALTERFW